MILHIIVFILKNPQSDTLNVSLHQYQEKLSFFFSSKIRSNFQKKHQTINIPKQYCVKIHELGGEGSQKS